jgi:hypothetical protein
MSACAFAASVPTIIAKTLKPPIRAHFMVYLLWTTGVRAR